jgi:hypothetical protein
MCNLGVRISKKSPTPYELAAKAYAVNATVSTQSVQNTVRIRLSLLGTVL